MGIQTPKQVTYRKSSQTPSLKLLKLLTKPQIAI